MWNAGFGGADGLDGILETGKLDFSICKDFNRWTSSNISFLNLFNKICEDSLCSNKHVWHSFAISWETPNFVIKELQSWKSILKEI